MNFPVFDFHCDTALVLLGDDNFSVNPGAGAANLLTIDQGVGAVKLRFAEK